MKRLLIVEDDEVFSSSLVRALSRRGYGCAIASDHKSTLELCGSFIPSHVLLDLQLGTESGQDLVAVIRSQLPSAQLVILTGFGTIPSSVQAMREGANYYLCKPASPDEIDAALSSTSSQISPSLEALQEHHIQKTLTQCAGNISQAARVLGIDRRTLQRKLNSKN